MTLRHWAVGALLFCAILFGTAGAFAPPDLDSPTVKVVLQGGHGSGVVIGDGSLILTAAHVAKHANKGNLTILTHDGREIPGRVLWIAVSDDVALIQIDERLTAAPLQCDKQSVGTAVEIVGHPHVGDTLHWMHTYAHIGAYYDKLPGWDAPVLMFDGSVYSGNSGGPMFNPAGEVVAIVVAISGVQVGFDGLAPYGFNLAVPATRICEMFP